MSMTVIEHIEVGSGGASSIEFTSIPDTYTDLQLVISPRNSAGGNLANCFVKFNGSSTGYDYRSLYSDGSSVASFSGTGQTSIDAQYSTAATTTANTFSSMQLYIPNYAGSSYKSVSYDGSHENNGTQAFNILMAWLWNNTSAISSIEITLSNSFVQYSSATLYGILAGSDGTTTVS